MSEAPIGVGKLLEDGRGPGYQEEPSCTRCPSISQPLMPPAVVAHRTWDEDVKRRHRKKNTIHSLAKASRARRDNCQYKRTMHAWSRSSAHLDPDTTGSTPPVWAAGWLAGCVRILILLRYKIYHTGIRILQKCSVGRGKGEGEGVVVARRQYVTASIYGNPWCIHTEGGNVEHQHHPQ